MPGRWVTCARPDDGMPSRWSARSWFSPLAGQLASRRPRPNSSRSTARAARWPSTRVAARPWTWGWRRICGRGRRLRRDPSLHHRRRHGTGHLPRDLASGDAFVATNRRRVEDHRRGDAPLRALIASGRHRPAAGDAARAQRGAVQLFLYGQGTGSHATNELYSIDLTTRTVTGPRHFDGQIRDLVFYDWIKSPLGIGRDSAHLSGTVDRSVRSYNLDLFTPPGRRASSATDLAFDEGRHQLYVVSGQSLQAIAVIDTSTDTVLSPLTEGPYIFAVAVDAARDRQFVVTRSLQLFDAGVATGTLPFQTQPGSVEALIRPRQTRTRRSSAIDGSIQQVRRTSGWSISPTPREPNRTLTRGRWRPVCGWASVRLLWRQHLQREQRWPLSERHRRPDSRPDPSRAISNLPWQGRGSRSGPGSSRRCSRRRPHRPARDWSRFDRLLAKAAGRRINANPPHLTTNGASAGREVTPYLRLQDRGLVPRRLARRPIWPRTAATAGSPGKSYRDGQSAEVVGAVQGRSHGRLLAADERGRGEFLGCVRRLSGW